MVGFDLGLLSFVNDYHQSISMLLYCTAMYQICGCWKKMLRNAVSGEINFVA